MSSICVPHLRCALLSDQWVVIAYRYGSVSPGLGHGRDLCHVNQPLSFLGATLFGEPDHIPVGQHGLETAANSLAGR